MTQSEINKLLTDAQLLRGAYNQGQIAATEGRMRQMLFRLNVAAEAASSKGMQLRIKWEIERYAARLRPLEYGAGKISRWS